MINAVHFGELTASVDARLDPAIEADAEAVARFLGAERELARQHCSSIASGVASPSGRLVSFNFTPAQVPYGVQAVREWLREQPSVRFVEVEWFRRHHRASDTTREMG